jgi:hypothetical protein
VDLSEHFVEDFLHLAILSLWYRIALTFFFRGWCQRACGEEDTFEEEDTILCLWYGIALTFIFPSKMRAFRMFTIL